MRYETAIAHFKTDTALADAAGVTRQAANLWKHDGRVPEGVAYKLQVITGGKLRVDPRQYQENGRKPK
jgi:hypothetical protein